MDIKKTMSFFTKKEEILEIIPQTLLIDAAGEFVVNYLIQQSHSEWIHLFEQAKSGTPGSYELCLGVIRQILIDQQITVIGKDLTSASQDIFRDNYGLRELDAFYKDDAVDEIRVAPNGQVWIVRKGILESTNIRYTDDEVATLINRLKPHTDMGVSLDEGNPTMELVRPDGSRLTALCRPVTSGYCFALRKHHNAVWGADMFIQKQTFDHKIDEILKILIKGRRNILICGGVNCGKTTLLRYQSSLLSPNLSIRSLDADTELLLAEKLQDREIWELEAHPEVGADMKHLFARILRLTPDVIIVPEFRGIGEVWTTIEACTRGHDGSMATAHYSSFAIEEVIRNIAMLAIQEGAALPIDLVIERVAQAFPIVVQMYSDTRKGIKKVTGITEVVVTNGKISFNPLLNWQPATEEYCGEGEWIIQNAPSEKCCRAMRIHGVDPEHIDRVFRRS